jgi:arsenate reductase (thioredoxin)
VENKTYNVLFLCTGNSARSVMAETLLNRWGKGRFQAFSAGSHPAGKINPFTLDLLKLVKLQTEGLRSKSWDEFAVADAPVMDFVFTVCDQAAGELCPIWPGQPISAHWGFPDPAAFVGPDVEKRAFFADVFRQIETRIKIFTSLPLEKLGRLAIQHEVDKLGERRLQKA